MRDTIAVDGVPIAVSSIPFWIVLHKPAGVLTTRSDPAGRTTVFDLIDDRPGLTYVGRLDYMTEGVLLLTSDGVAAHTLTHPSNGGRADIHRRRSRQRTGSGPSGSPRCPVGGWTCLPATYRCASTERPPAVRVGGSHYRGASPRSAAPL